MDLGAMEGPWEQLIEDPGVDLVPIGGDLDRWDPGAIDRRGVVDAIRVRPTTPTLR